MAQANYGALKREMFSDMQTCFQVVGIFESVTRSFWIPFQVERPVKAFSNFFFWSLFFTSVSPVKDRNNRSQKRRTEDAREVVPEQHAVSKGHNNEPTH